MARKLIIIIIISTVLKALQVTDLAYNLRQERKEKPHLGWIFAKNDEFENWSAAVVVAFF